MHRLLIIRLGGQTVVAKLLGQKVSAVGNWMRRGIPWRWRPRVAQLAEQRGIDLPDGFLDNEVG